MSVYKEFDKIEERGTLMTITIKDVAKEAGVSTGTVSKVLKNYPNISEETKKKVHAAVKKLNYVPNYSASILSSKNNTKVAIYININDQIQAVDEINMQYILGAFSKAKEIGLDIVTIFNDSVSNYNAEELTHYLIAQGINGIVIYGLNKEDSVIHELIDSKRFYITVIDAPAQNEKTSSVMVDHVHGQYDVAKKLIQPNNRNKMLYLAGKKNGYVTDMRIQGIKKLQEDYKFELDIVYADFSEKKAYELTLKHASDYDLIVCASDLMAIGAVNALIFMNIFRRCCGYDGITLMAYSGKQMYTCIQNFKEVSKRGIEEIQKLINGAPPQSILLDYEVNILHYRDIIQ